MENRLAQVLLNLFRNNIEAIDITAPEKSISVHAYTNAGQLILQVKDNGKRFDKFTAGQLFTKGFTTTPSGSGRGVYNCKAIPESHGGAIVITKSFVSSPVYFRSSAYCLAGENTNGLSQLLAL